MVPECYHAREVTKHLECLVGFPILHESKNLIGSTARHNKRCQSVPMEADRLTGVDTMKENKVKLELLRISPVFVARINLFSTPMFPFIVSTPVNSTLKVEIKT